MNFENKLEILENDGKEVTFNLVQLKIFKNAEFQN